MKFGGLSQRWEKTKTGECGIAFRHQHDSSLTEFFGMGMLNQEKCFYMQNGNT